ncbi:hypothetical protein BHE74_00050059 [Ensete ventricosum]|nr:hypothetical protein BHE74_00050059 [Ensete ventricosum]
MLGWSQVRVSDRGSDDVVGAHREFARNSPKVIGKLAGSIPGVRQKMIERLTGSSSNDAWKFVRNWRSFTVEIHHVDTAREDDA